ncbi:hypothetical protein B0H66DRAFT_471776 [Apodospora peruviana]|uniref:Uncharacterized protein n=1 Tax=Apodospora peruviana TaxID=516989 RepID=A0AAE0IJD6_9PEZI|nr:hypothetical protein B0H66DRAFT_471776 [Apodospora peruviana]
MAGGLANSRHAPGRPNSASPSTRPWTPPQGGTTLSVSRPPPPLTITPALTGNGGTNGHNTGLGSPTFELLRFTKIIRRLKWKLPFLGQGYWRAVSRLGQDRAHIAEAELMFKLDFFEFYALIERALVHLMGVFDIHISPGYPSSSVQRQRLQRRIAGKGLVNSAWNDGSSLSSNSRNETIVDSGVAAGGGGTECAGHRYHANVLEALDNEDNPLHGVLGTGDVRRQLARAKELRNRWKTADNDDDEDNGHRGNNVTYSSSTTRTRRKFEVPPLESYNPEGILETVFRGFDAAFVIAQRFVQGLGRVPSPAETDVDMVDWAIAAAVAAGEKADDDETQWEFMTDAMDWEAV